MFSSNVGLDPLSTVYPPPPPKKNISNIKHPPKICEIFATQKIISTFYIVYVEWASRVNFVTIFGDLYQNKLWVICNNFNQFAHLSSASGPSNDVIKMAARVLLMYTYKTSYLKQ